MIYDIIIAGGGPAGLTAALYSCRAGRKTLMICRGFPGGQIMQADIIENYPGFPDGISGMELGSLFYAQAEKYGLETVYDGVSAIEDEGAVKKVVSDSGTVYRSQAVILATGASPRRLDIPGEDRLTGKGVSYCATCDGALFKGRTVAVIGGGDTAVGEAVFLTRFAEKVYLIHRRDAFRASKILQERAFANEKVSVLWNRAPVEIIGKDRVESLLLRDTLSGGEETLLCDGVFVLAGTVPESSFVKGLVSLDENGYIITDSRMGTSVPGIFSAGDVNKKDFRQVATAVGDGANAAHFAEIYLESLK